MLVLITMQKSKSVQAILYLYKRKKKTFHHVIILIKSVWNKDKNNNYYNMFLEKASNELP